jgi:hypothetical protein
MLGVGMNRYKLKVNCQPDVFFRNVLDDVPLRSEYFLCTRK